MAQDFNTLVTLALQRLGQRQNDPTLTSQLQAEIPPVQVALEDDANAPRPWFLRTVGDQSSWLKTVANNNAIVLPSSFLCEDVDAALYIIVIDPSTGIQTKQPLIKGAYDDIQMMIPQPPEWSPDLPVVGTPQYYTLGPTAILLFPTPDQVYQLEWSYFSRDSTLTTQNPTNKWTSNAWNLLLWRLCEVGALGYTHDAQFAQVAAQQAQRYYLQFRGTVIERDLTNRQLHMSQLK